MDDKQQNTAIAAAPEQGKSPPAPAQPKKREFVSKGEQIHQWATYLSVDVVLNAIAGVAFAYWGNYTKVGQKLWKDPVTKASEKVLGLAIKDSESLAASVKNVRGFASIIAGGMLFTIPPLMLLENKKVKKSITQRLDRHIYGKEVCENDPKFQKAYDEIDNAPEKGFVVGNVARYAALAPLLASVMIPGPREVTTERFLEPFGKQLEKLAVKMGATPEKLFKNLSEAERNERWKFLRENAAMDVGFELPYAALHYAFYNMFAGMAARRKAGKEAGDNEVQAIVPVSQEVVHDVEKDLEKFGESTKIKPRPAGFTQREMPPASFTDRADTPTQDHAAAR